MKTFADRVPDAARDVKDPLNMKKEVADLTNQLKQLFFENKTLHNSAVEAEKSKRKAQITLEGLMKDKNLVLVNGTIQAKQQVSHSMQKVLRMADIPDYDSLLVRENPLEPVVRKLASKGWTAAQAFKIFDEDEDEVLTIKEIIEGLKFHEVGLLDTEYKQMIDKIDQNNDGVLTQQEWQDCLNPRVDAQKQFMTIMKGLNITDPLILEEQVLDLTFDIRRMRKDIAVLKRTKGKDMFFRKKQVENESKEAAQKLKDLETKVGQSKFREAESMSVFAQNWKDTGLQTAADIEDEYNRLLKSKEEMTIRYSEQKESQKQALIELDGRYNSVLRQTEDVRIKREINKVKLSKMQLHLDYEREREKQLDAEIAKVLGRAVTMEDLELLFQQDLKLLN